MTVHLNDLLDLVKKKIEEKEFEQAIRILHLLADYCQGKIDEGEQKK